MTQYNTLNVKLSNSQLNKLKSVTKNHTQVSINLSSNVIGDGETNFTYKLLLTKTQVSKIRKGFANGSTANIKFSETQLSKTVQLGGFLDKLLGLLIKTGLPLIRNVLKPLAKSVLVPLGLTAAASATDASIQKKTFESGTATLIFSNRELNDIMKIVKEDSVEDSGLLIKGVTETVENEMKEQKGEFFNILADTLGASSLETC